MSYSMMFKKTFMFLAILLMAAGPACFNVKAQGNLPAGEVLLVCSDSAFRDGTENVDRIVEMLTYEGVQVTFAPASRCVGRLSYFDQIIFYELEDYPLDLIEEIKELEKKIEENVDTAGEAKHRLLFVGNHFLKDYLDRTQRNTSYTICDEEVGSFMYEFGVQNRKQSLVSLKELIFLEGDHEYEAGTILAGLKEGYFCARQGVITHISVSDLSNPLALSAFTKEVAVWRAGNREVEEYAQYIVFHKVYPFQDPNKLFAIVHEMAERDTPFIISVMPIYEHVNYPAMQHFCEVLRYAQDNGGIIFLHAPINQMENFDVDLVNEYLSLAVNAYVDQDVYPMGLQVPENWMTNSSTVEVMSRFHTILVSAETDGRIEADWMDAESNLIFRDAHQWIAPAIALNDEGTSYFSTYSTAVYLDVNEEIDQIKQKIETCENSFVPLKNLWEVTHSFYTNSTTMSYRGGNIFINGSQVDKTFIPAEYEEDFAYNRNQLQRFSRDLTNENHKLIIAVAFVATLFVIFIIIARRNNRSRFFYTDEEEDMDEYWENKG